MLKKYITTFSCAMAGTEISSVLNFQRFFFLAKNKNIKYKVLVLRFLFFLFLFLELADEFS
jgi:hypothetical protein